MVSRIHTYAALATLVNLMVYAAAGVASRALPAPVAWEQPFRLAPGESDRAAAERVVRLLNLSLATPVHNFNIGHDKAGRLTFDFYHANGRHKITVLPGMLHIEATRAGFGRYLSTLHVTTAAFHSGDWRMQLWAWYNEFAMWALAVMLATGGWMLFTRRGKPGLLRRTHWLTSIAGLPVLAIFAATAIQMAHRSWLPAGTMWRALDGIHRARVPAVAASLLLLVLGTTGIGLWLRGRFGRTGGVLLAVGAAVSGGLLLWMREG